jgi:hypothetical protein
MAGQERRDTRAHERSFRPALSPVVAVVTEAGTGSATTPTGSTARTARTATRATYRTLLLRGLAPEEAANLTAYLCGIQLGSQPWKLDEVNRILFLRELHGTGRFGINDGAGPQ